jgi:hypothetical protein
MLFFFSIKMSFNLQHGALHCKSRNNSKFYPYLRDCIRALDGPRIPYLVPESRSAAFRNRKETLSQNILGVVAFDMSCVFIYAGWERSAHDERVLRDAFIKGFCVLIEKYYLGDTGYALSPNVLTPYRWVSYHLNEHKHAAKRYGPISYIW